MNHEHPPKCDHDDNVMCTHKFLQFDIQAHRCRQRINGLIDGKQHWVFAITAECRELFARLLDLAKDIDNDDLAVIPLPLPSMPVMVCMPRSQVSLDDLSDLVDFTTQPREAYESKDFTVITSDNQQAVSEAVSQWLALDHLLN